MTQVEQLQMLKVLTKSKDNEVVLSVYLDLAGEAIINKAYPYRRDDDEPAVPARYHRKQVEIAAYLYEKSGALGQSEHAENGVEIVYGGADIPDDMLHEIVPKVGVFG